MAMPMAVKSSPQTSEPYAAVKPIVGFISLGGGI